MRVEIVPYLVKKTVYFEKVRTNYKCVALTTYKERVNYYYKSPSVWADLVIRAVEKDGEKIGVHSYDHVMYEVPDDFLDIVHDIISIKNANYSRLLRFELPETYEEFVKKIHEIKDLVGVKMIEREIRGK